PPPILHLLRWFYFPLDNVPAWSRTKTPPLSIHTTLSLHDALPIYPYYSTGVIADGAGTASKSADRTLNYTVNSFLNYAPYLGGRSEEHTSELQSRENLVCRLLLEKKKRTMIQPRSIQSIHPPVRHL